MLLLWIDFRRVFRVEALQLNLRFLKNIQREGVRVALLIHDAADACIDNHLCADAARLMRAVKRRAVDGNAKFRRLKTCRERGECMRDRLGICLLYTSPSPRD